MKRLMVAAAGLVCASSAHAEEAWVQVRESVIRSQPMFYASSVTAVKYGDRLQVISDEKGWAKVRSGGKEGYLPISVVTRQQVVLSGRTVTKVRADSADVVLAGKGFSKEVEEQYKQQDASARYDLVDRLERQTVVASKEVQLFIKSGGLKG